MSKQPLPYIDECNCDQVLELKEQLAACKASCVTYSNTAKRSKKYYTKYLQEKHRRNLLQTKYKKLLKWS